MIQISHYSYHIPMLLRDHAIDSIRSTQEVDCPLEPASMPHFPPLRPCQLRQLDPAPISNVVEWIPGVDFSVMQSINPALVFPNASSTTSESLDSMTNIGVDAEFCTIPSGTSISFTWLFDQPQENPQIIQNTIGSVTESSWLDCHVNNKRSGHNLHVEDQESDIHKRKFKCKIIGCGMSFKRQDHLERHKTSHLKEKSHICWVPGCHRAFSRHDNLKAHCIKTHARRGGRNRYVATLDETSPDYDPEFRGQLSFEGRPLRYLASIDSVPEAKS